MLSKSQEGRLTVLPSTKEIHVRKHIETHPQMRHVQNTDYNKGTTTGHTIHSGAKGPSELLANTLNRPKSTGQLVINPALIQDSGKMEEEKEPEGKCSPFGEDLSGYLC